jgi:hypothetical protein
MLIPSTAVHRAALVLREQGDITETMFEDAYHCRIGKLSPDVVNYYDIYFDTEEYATMFMLRWM